MSNALPSLLEVVNADNLPSPPTVATEILRVTRDEGVSLNDLAALISRDPALSAKFLKLANSSLFPSNAEVTSLDKAVMRLGIKTVKLMALSFSLVGSKSEGGGLDFDAFWGLSLTQAVAARELAQRSDRRVAEEAFLCGILGRIGQLAMNQVIPEAFSKVIQDADGIPTAAQEREALGFDYHEVGGALLQRWELPERIHRTVAQVGIADEAEGEAEVQLLARLECVAEVAARVIFSENKGEALQELHQVAFDHVQLDEDEIEEFLVDLESQLREAAQLLSIDINSDQSYDQVVAEARMQMMQISLGNAIDLHQTSARNEELTAERDRLDEIAHTDKLTGIPNRSAFDKWLEDECLAAAKDPQRTLGLLVMDVDKFKLFNDTHGHLVGDEVLKVVGQTVADNVSGTVQGARYGGEEFVVVMPEASLEELRAQAEKIRAAIEAAEVKAEGKVLSVTISIGGALSRGVDRMELATDLVKQADGMLYEAKEAGRNQCICNEVVPTSSGA
jgi:diguanylate cyclase (GGDEF)-like protein